MIFQIILSTDAGKTLANLDRPSMRRITERLDQLVSDPLGPRFSKALAHPKDLRVSRVGDWRILFTADTARGLVKIQSIGSRGQVYRGL